MLGKLFGSLQIPLCEIVLRLAGLEADVIPPAKPGVTLEDRLDLSEDWERLFTPACAQVIDPNIDQGVAFGF